MSTDKNLFEMASRGRYRYPSQYGLVSTEDLWAFPLGSLDATAKEINAALGRCQEESFVETGDNAEAESLTNRLNVLKHIIAIRLAEREVAENAQKRKAEKQALLEILHDKKTEGLKALSVEEIEAKIAAL